MSCRRSELQGRSTTCAYTKKKPPNRLVTIQCADCNEAATLAYDNHLQQATLNDAEKAAGETHTPFKKQLASFSAFMRLPQMGYTPDKEVH